MTTQLYRVRLKPLTAFATPLRGDTLFGQVCWHLRHTEGEATLSGYLHGYLEQSPFLVLSDAFPAGYLPRPTLPLSHLGMKLDDPRSRKAAKSRKWLPLATLALPVAEWHSHLVTSGDIAATLVNHPEAPLWQEQVRTHNSINRLTQTTGAGEQGFAPYERQLTWYHPELALELYAALGEGMTPGQLHHWLQAVGLHGYGKEASSGLGKFDVIEVAPLDAPTPPAANAWLTLAPCAPQGGQWRAEHCFYQPHVRFGMHGAQAVLAGTVPWKNPVLLADTAALLTPDTPPAGRHGLVGRGLAGLSHAVPNTVHQGYAPVLPVQHSMNITNREACA